MRIRTMLRVAIWSHFLLTMWADAKRRKKLARRRAKQEAKRMRVFKKQEPARLTALEKELEQEALRLNALEWPLKPPLWQRLRLPFRR